MSRIQLIDFMPKDSKDTTLTDKKKRKSRMVMHEELTEKEKEELAELEQLKLVADGQSQEN